MSRDIPDKLASDVDLAAIANRGEIVVSGSKHRTPALRGDCPLAGLEHVLMRFSRAGLPFAGPLWSWAARYVYASGLLLSPHGHRG